ncbi:MAG TPA: polyprenyl synthetase family protein [Dehalococcoidia bacterium]|nr:polyprenyl synthetase family protein [Dehalococcoidia bacterium]
MTSSPELLFRYRDAIEREVVRSLPPSSSPLDEMLRFYFGWTEEGAPSLAKCLRPSLCLTACESLGGDVEQALPIAVAIELVHNFSLIHDDIEDGDEMRHHRPALWHAYGRQPAIFAGVALWSIAYQTLDRALERGLAAERVLAARRVLNDACLEMIEGQHLDLSYEQRSDVTLAEYIDMIGRKSGALLGASLQLGALVAGCDDEECERFATFGRQLGLAFQIRDDVLGIWGEGSATGKPVGADIARKKKSLPVVHAFQQVVGPDRDILVDAYGKDEVDEADIAEVLSILQRWNCRYFAQGLAEDYRSRAMEELSRTPISPEARRSFDELMSFVLERDY